MKRCPHCGQPLPLTGEELAARMAGGLDCYEAADGGYFLTQGGGKVSRAAIDDALAKGLIVPKWDDSPHLAYWRFAPRQC